MLTKQAMATALAVGSLCASAQELSFTWRELPPIPANRSEWSDAIPVKAPWWQQIGLAGPVVGVHRDFLLVGGGANFPEPGLTATRANRLGKVYWDEVFVLDLNRQRWLERRFRLPRALAYAATLSLPEGVLVIGGEGHESPNGNARSKLKPYADVFLMRLDDEARALEFKPYPSLPRPISYGAAALLGRTVYVQSGKDFLALDLDALDQGWRSLAPWPGEARDLALATGVNGVVVLASGRLTRDGVSTVHKDAYAYDPRSRSWSVLPEMPHAAQAGEAFAVQDRFVVLMGGDGNLERWNQFFALEGQRNRAQPGSVEWEQANTAVTFLQDHHTGFNQDILVFDTQTRRWGVAGHLPAPGPVTTQPVTWRGELLLVSGEVGPGKRTPKIWAGRPQLNK